jgi:voltage-gated potassium channel
MRPRSSTLGRVRVRLRRLFYGHRPAAVAFQAGLLAIDIAAIGYFIATSFVADATWLRVVDLLLGILLALEFLGRMLAHRHPMAYLINGAALWTWWSSAPCSSRRSVAISASCVSCAPSG